MKRTPSKKQVHYSVIVGLSQPVCPPGTRRIGKGVLSRWRVAAAVLAALSMSFVSVKGQQSGAEEALDFTSLGSTGFDYTQGSYTLGWRFTAKTNARVIALGFYDDLKNGLTQSHPVGIYDVQTRALVASTIVLPSDPLTGFFRYHSITPVTLVAGRDYYAMALTLTEHYAVHVATLNVSPQITFVGFGGTNPADYQQTTLRYPDQDQDLPGFHGDFGPSFILASATQFSGAPGTADVSFGTTGTATLTQLQPKNTIINAVTTQADGKIIVAGQTVSSGSILVWGYFVARYNVDGTIDATFGNGGVITDRWLAGDSIAHAVAVQSDGKIVIAGIASDLNGGNKFGLARLNQNGSYDKSFNSTGKLVSAVAGNRSRAYCMALLGSDILVAGDSIVGDAHFALARFKSDGSVDTSFGSNGAVVTTSGSVDVARAILLERTGIVLAGYSSNGHFNFSLVRYDFSGKLDPAFGTAGKVITDFGSSIQGFSAALSWPPTIAAGQQIVIAGTASNGVGGHFALARYNYDGKLDTTFGNKGLVRTDFGGEADTAYGVVCAIPTDSSQLPKIIALGGNGGGSGAASNFLIARYNADGSLDPTFGNGGKVSQPIGQGTVNVAYAVTLDFDKIIAAGVTNNGPNYQSGAVLRIMNGPFQPVPISAGSQVTVRAPGVSATFSNVSGSGNIDWASLDPVTRWQLFNYLFELSLIYVPPGPHNANVKAELLNQAAQTLSGLPDDYTVCPTCAGYDISTNAAYTPPVTVCIDVPSTISASTFGAMRLYHLEDGVFVDRTSSRPVASDGTRSICGQVDSLSLFFIGQPMQAQNISTRAEVLGGDKAAIAGFIVAGTDTKKVLIRALGPTLAKPPFNVPGSLANPVLELHGTDSTGHDIVIATNDNWKDAQQAAIQATGKSPPDDLEAAIVQDLAPGNYTAILRGVGSATGVGLIEVYDTDSNSNSRLRNISTRAFVGTNNQVMIGGFITDSDGANLMVRVLGPTLSQFGVAGVLADPIIQLFDGQGNLVSANDNWQDSQGPEIEMTGYAPPDSHEAALVVTRPAGNTTAIVSGRNGATGVALVEVYCLP